MPNGYTSGYVLTLLGISAVFSVFALGFILGARYGTNDAAGRFEESCRGGQAYFDEGGKVFEAMGCAEIAKRIK
jgi:hypothetical protein